MNRGKVLLMEMEKKGYNRNTLSKESGVAYSTIDSMIKRDLKNASIDNVLKICSVLGISSSVFETHETPSNLEKIEGEFVQVPILGTIACGDPIIVEENISEYKTEVANQLPAGELFYLKAKGDSMSPTIPNESLVLIRFQNDVESGEVAAVLLNGDEEATLKRVKKQGDIVVLLPDNNSYEPIFVTKDNPARIIGKALEIRTLL